MDCREGRYTAQDGLDLYYREYGSALSRRTPVLCLAGLTRNSTDFEAFAKRISAGRRVLCPDLRGRGRSDRDPHWRNYNPRTYINDIVPLLPLANVQRVIVVGTSFGGAWTARGGALALGGHTESVAAAGGDPWQLYPMVPANGQVGFAIGWFGFGLLAALVQLRWSSPMRRRKRRSSEDDK